MVCRCLCLLHSLRWENQSRFPEEEEDRQPIATEWMEESWQMCFESNLEKSTHYTQIEEIDVLLRCNHSLWY